MLDSDRPGLISSAFSWLFVLSLLGAAIGCLAYERDYIAAGALGVIGLAAISGHRAGVSGMVGLV